MPMIYLSPSTQEYNLYVTGSGSEEFQMNRIADAMVPYLDANTITYRRNTPEMTAASSIRQAGEIAYDFYLSLHSNASPESKAGQERGIIGFYYPTSVDGKRGATLLCDALRTIYPLKDDVSVVSTTSLGEVRQPTSPSVLMEIGFHDNASDAVWVETHTEAIAQQLVRGLTQYFGLPFIQPQSPRPGVVRLTGGTLNMRSYPSSTGTVIANLPNNAELSVLGEWEGWYSVAYNGLLGYAAAAYIQM